MPLVKGHSNKAVNQNIRELIKAGHPHNQAVAIALHTANKPKRTNGKTK